MTWTQTILMILAALIVAGLLIGAEDWRALAAAFVRLWKKWLGGK